MDGSRLYRARKDAGLTQVQLAELAGINQTTLSRWEREGMAFARPICAIADRLGVSVDWLVCDEGGAEEAA